MIFIDVMWQKSYENDLETLILRKNRVAPEGFELVKAPRILVKNVDDGVEVVQEDPQAVLLALKIARQQIAFLFEATVDVIGDGIDLGVRISFANNEEIRWGLFQLSQVKLDDVFAFDVLNGVNDQIVQGFDGQLYWRAILCTQIVFFVTFARNPTPGTAVAAKRLNFSVISSKKVLEKRNPRAPKRTKLVNILDWIL